MASWGKGTMGIFSFVIVQKKRERILESETNLLQISHRGSINFSSLLSRSSFQAMREIQANMRISVFFVSRRRLLPARLFASSASTLLQNRMSTTPETVKVGNNRGRRATPFHPTYERAPRVHKIWLTVYPEYVQFN